MSHAGLTSPLESANPNPKFDTRKVSLLVVSGHSQNHRSHVVEYQNEWYAEQAISHMRCNCSSNVATSWQRLYNPTLSINNDFTPTQQEAQ